MYTITHPPVWPKKFVGYQMGNFIQQRQEGIQYWFDEIFADEELSEDGKVRRLLKSLFERIERR
jgi:hypothetical protein